MIRTRQGSLSFAATMFVLTLGGYAFAGPGKVDVCHFPDGQPGHVIRVSSRSLSAHRSHGDCTDFVLDGTNHCSCPLQDLISQSKYAAKLTFPATTSWDIRAVQADPAFADGTIEGDYLVVRGRQFADWDLGRNEGNVPETIPQGIGLQYAFGSDNTIWVFTDAPLPHAFMTLFGFPNTAARNTILWTPFHFDLSEAELQQLWDHGIQSAVNWHDKFMTLPEIGMQLYKQIRDRALTHGALTNYQIVDETALAVLNNTGRRTAIGFAKNGSDCLGGAFFLTNDYVSRWWPKGLGDRCGNAEWGFAVHPVNPGSSWFTYSVAYGDNGTLQTVLWDGQVHVQHANYGSAERATISPDPLPGTVTLRHQYVWSGNDANFTVVLQADALELGDTWESPQVGDVPVPIVRYLETGWNTWDSQSPPPAEPQPVPSRGRTRLSGGSD